MSTSVWPVMSMGKGRLVSSLKAFRKRISAIISNCLPTDLDVLLGSENTRSTTSSTRTRVKVWVTASKRFMEMFRARNVGSQPRLFISMSASAARITPSPAT